MPSRVLAHCTPTMTATPRILLIDDNAAFSRIVADCLSAAGYAVDVATNGERGLELFRTRRPDVVLLDLGLPGMSGTTALAELRRLDRTVPILVLSGEPDPHLAHSLVTRGAFACLQKPFALGELERVVSSALSAA